MFGIFKKALTPVEYAARYVEDVLQPHFVDVAFDRVDGAGGSVTVRSVAALEDGRIQMVLEPASADGTRGAPFPCPIQRFEAMTGNALPLPRPIRDLQGVM